MINTVYIDVDGTIVDLINPLCLHHNIINPYSIFKNYGEYDLSKVMETPKEGIWNGLTSQFWADLPIMPDGLEIISRCRKICSNIVFTTTPINNDCVIGKLNWLNRHYPDHNLIITYDKSDLAGPGKLLVDDCDNNIKDFRMAGGQAYLVPRLWNSAWAWIK